MIWPIAAALVLLAALSTGVLGSALWDLLRTTSVKQRCLGVGVALVVAVGTTAALSAKFLPSDDITLSDPALQPWGALPKARSLDEVTRRPTQYQVTVEWKLERADLDPKTLKVGVALICLVPDGKTLGGMADGTKTKVTEDESFRTVDDLKYLSWDVTVPVDSVTNGAGFVTIGPLSVTGDCGRTWVHAIMGVSWRDFSGKSHQVPSGSATADIV